MPKTRLQELTEHGQSVWLDYLSRDILDSGKLAQMMDRDAVVGVTSNPTIFQKALSSGDAYDEQLRELLEHEQDEKEIFLALSAEDVKGGCALLHEQDEKEIFLALSAEDVKGGCALLRPVWDSSDHTDGYVSWEVDPELAYEREQTFEEAKRLHEWIDEPNLYVKIPATEPGLGAIEDSIAAGRNINVTLIFSLERYKAVLEAYVRGVERLVADGGDPACVHSVASFFVSRVDTETDKRLDKIGTPEALALRGKLAIANAKLAYQHYKQVVASDRWQALAAKGATPQRCLWASTSTKNPEYRDVMYVEELIGPETVDTMPEETIEAFQAHGVVADRLETGLDEARELLTQLRDVGIAYDDVTDVLEREGVQKFTDSFVGLKQGIREKRDVLAPA